VAITNGYVTRAEVQNALGLGTATLVPDSEEIDQVITSVSRAIDDYCGRFFYSVAGTVTYTANDYLYLPIGDWSAVTSIKTDEDNDGTPEVTLTAGTDYRLATNKVVPGWPYTAIQITSFASHTLPLGVTEGVEVVGTRGWGANAVPAPVTAGALLQVCRIHARRQSPYGVAGSPEGGIVRLLSRLDPDVELMLRPYRVIQEAI
jgi:hypothetical protein